MVNFKRMKGKTTDMLVLASNPRNVRKVEPFVEQITSRLDVQPSVHGNILISLTEAVTNAIVHGNDMDESKKVAVRLKKYPKGNKIAFLVKDEGRGFDYKGIPDPTKPENICKIGGRGVFLMTQLTDNIVFHGNGSTVELQFEV